MTDAGDLAHVREKYRDRVPMLALKRFYSTPKDEKPMTRAEETAKVQAVWKESYPGLANVPVAIDGDAMVMYGGSATPSFVLIDRKGLVRTLRRFVCRSASSRERSRN